MVNLWVIYIDLISMYMDNKIKIIIYTAKKERKKDLRKRKKAHHYYSYYKPYKCSKILNTRASTNRADPDQTASKEAV